MMWRTKRFAKASESPRSKNSETRVLILSLCACKTVVRWSLTAAVLGFILVRYFLVGPRTPVDSTDVEFSLKEDIFRYTKAQTTLTGSHTGQT
jgi:hypothetical protein